MLSDHMLRQMVDAMPMPVFVKDEDDNFVYANRAFETLFQVRAVSLTQSGARHGFQLPTSPGQLIESTTFCTPNGDRLTMSMVHTESFTSSHSPQLEAVESELRQVRAELARVRETDPVTQALSRRALRAHTEDAFATAPAGVLRISVDDLESITEQFGHDVSDELLADFSDIVRSTTRPIDVFARIGEADFVLLLNEADREQTASVARRICAAVTDARTADGHPRLALSVTVGAAYSDASETQLSAVIAEAERALSSANRFCNEAVVV